MRNGELRTERRLLLRHCTEEKVVSDLVAFRNELDDSSNIILLPRRENFKYLKAQQNRESSS